MPVTEEAGEEEDSATFILELNENIIMYDERVVSNGCTVCLASKNRPSSICLSWPKAFHRFERIHLDFVDWREQHILICTDVY